MVMLCFQVVLTLLVVIWGLRLGVFLLMRYAGMTFQMKAKFFTLLESQGSLVMRRFFVAFRCWLASDFAVVHGLCEWIPSQNYVQQSVIYNDRSTYCHVRVI